MQKDSDSLRERRGKRIKMPERTWRDRLRFAIKRDKRSMRAISIAAGQSESYVWEMLNRDKEPTIGPLQKVCSVLGVTLTYITEGYEITPESERILRAVARMTQEQQIAFLAYIESQKPR
jgi:transcriptional regulator with XRE-family HTH domain